MEYEDVLVQGDERAAGAELPAVRRARPGARAALRHDDPDRAPGRRRAIADAEPPLRLCYLSHAYRAVRPQRGQQREFLQAGIELIGAEAPEGTVEVLEVLCAALDAAGLPRARIGLGDAGPVPQACSRAMGVERDGAERGAARRSSATTSSRSRQRVGELGVATSASATRSSRCRSCAAAPR